MGLVINREKTQVVDLEQKDHLDFLAFTFRFDADRFGRGHRYLNVFPSKKAVAHERDVLRRMTSPRMCFKPIPALVQQLNTHLNGWANYFKFGYPRKIFREINFFVCRRLTVHLNRRSQRPFRPPKGITLYRHLRDLGLVGL